MGRRQGVRCFFQLGVCRGSGFVSRRAGIRDRFSDLWRRIVGLRNGKYWRDGPINRRRSRTILNPNRLQGVCYTREVAFCSPIKNCSVADEDGLFNGLSGGRNRGHARSHPVGHDLWTFRGKEAFWMELDAFDRVRTMAQPHDDPVGSLGRDLQFGQ